MAATTLSWGYLSAAAALVAILVAFGVAMLATNRSFMRLHRTYADGLVQAQEQERAWVAAEIHDDALQRIMLLLHELDGLQAEIPATAGRLAAVREELEDLSQSLRQMAYRLHPSIVRQAGLLPALEQLAVDVTRTSPVRIEVRGEVPPAMVSEEQALVAYRIAQEAISNVVRHAGSATASVRVAVRDGAIELEIADRGRGFNVDRRRSGGLGLIAMVERARGAGGAAEIASVPGAGTTIHARVPRHPLR